MNMDELLLKIDSMKLYEKDYDTILKLYNFADNRFFTKVIEEILNGTIYFSDLENIFKDANYTNLLSKNFEAQKKISEQILRMIDFRENILAIDTSSDISDYSKTRLGLQYPGDYSIDEDEELIDLLTKDNAHTILNNEATTLSALLRTHYDKDQYALFNSLERNNLLYTLFDGMENDTEIVKAAKLRVYNATQRYLGNISSNGESVNPDDILISVDNYIIPFTYDNIILNKADYDFMLRNNISEDELKKIKTVSLFLKKKDIYDNYNENTYKSKLSAGGTINNIAYTDYAILRANLAKLKEVEEA